MQILRRTGERLFPRELKRKPNKQKRRDAQGVRDKEEGKSSIPGISFSLIPTTPPNKAPQCRFSSFHKGENRFMEAK